MHKISGIIVDLDDVSAMITRHPRSQAVNPGQDFVLHCDADVIENRPRDQSFCVVYSWELNNFPTTVIQPKSSQFANHSLYVPRVAQTDTGTYQCIVEVIHPSQGNITVWSALATVVLAYIEPFQSDPAPRTQVTQGSDVVLECVTGRSAPPPTVHWEKDGQELTAYQQELSFYGVEGEGCSRQLSSRLSFTARPSDGGTYYCVATNPMNGHLYKSAGALVNVRVPQVAPYIFGNLPEHLLWTASLPAQMTCPIIAHPAAEITWIKDGIVIVNSTTEGTLQIGEVLPEDAGLYHCSGSNQLGTIASPTGNVTVAYIGLNFVSQPTDSDILAGSSAMLRCIPPPSYPGVKITWYKDSSLLIERSGTFGLTISLTGDLHINNVQMSDQGQYVCVATNDLAIPPSRSSQPAYLTVASSPRIRQPPISQKIIKGQTLRLTCVIDAKPSPTITWFKDQNGQEKVTPTNDGRIDIVKGGTELIISNILKADENSYRCHGNNKYGNITSSRSSVQVLVPPEIVSRPHDLTVLEGRPVLLPCLVYGYPTPNISWFKDGYPLNTTRSTYITQSDGLQISSVARVDTASFSCRAQNEAGSQESSTRLSIQVPPEFASYPENTTVNESASVLFHCSAFGIPAVNISWTFNGYNSFPESTEISVDGSTVTIPRAGALHDGIYRCSAHSELGSIQSAARLIVQQSSIISGIYRNGSFVWSEITLNMGDNLDLRCNATGNPIPEISWYFNNVRIHPTANGRVSLPTASRLLVQFPTPADMGEYSCVAQNAAGSDNAVLQVNVQDVLPSPYLTSAVPISRTSVQLSLRSPHFLPYQQLLGFQLQLKTSSSLVYEDYTKMIRPSELSIEVENLQPATSYVLRMSSINAVGRGSYSNVLGATTLQSAPSPPRNLSLRTQTGNILTLQWSSPLQPDGVVRLYQLQYWQGSSPNEIETLDIPQDLITKQFIQLEYLRSYTTYVIRCRAANIQDGSYLFGDWSPTIQATTSATEPSEAVGKPTLSVVSSTTIHISWQSVAMSTKNVVIYREDGRLQNKQITVDASQQSVNIDGLLPWRYYDVTIYAYNNVGRGPASEVARARTMAEVPSGSPVNFQAVSNSSTGIIMQWQPVPVELRNSEISGYIIEQGWANNTISLYVGSSDTLIYHLVGLDLYTEYTLRLRAFTTLIDNGFGPFTSYIYCKTLEGAPTKVTHVYALPMVNSIKVGWSQPNKLNGELRGYVILFQESSGLLSDSDADITLEASSPMNFIYIYSANSNTQPTEYTIHGLLPDTFYNISIAAWTGGGRGNYFNFSVQTVADSSYTTDTYMAPENVNDITTEGLNSTLTTVITQDLVINHLGLSESVRTAILAGSVSGGILLLLLCTCLFGMVYWRKRRHRLKKRNYNRSMYFQTSQPAFIRAPGLNTNFKGPVTDLHPYSVEPSIDNLDKHSATTKSFHMIRPALVNGYEKQDMRKGNAALNQASHQMVRRQQPLFHHPDWEKTTSSIYSIGSTERELHIADTYQNSQQRTAL